MNLCCSFRLRNADVYTFSKWTEGLACLLPSSLTTFLDCAQPVTLEIPPAGHEDTQGRGLSRVALPGFSCSGMAACGMISITIIRHLMIIFSVSSVCLSLSANLESP